MRLIRLEVQNFRSFYGTKTLEFSIQKKRPVTIIYGDNGTGKTNLLNALYWCLIGGFTPQFKRPDMLINKAAKKENNRVKGYVEVLFELDELEYRARRSFSYAGGTPTFLVYQIGRDGAENTVPNAQNFIQRVIPKALSKWFFFDAEAIGELTLSGGEEFKRSIRRTLGFELVDTLSNDLEFCLNKKQRELSKAVKSKDLDEIQKLIDNLIRVLPDQKNELQETRTKILTVNKKLNEADSKLRELPQSRPLQDSRSRIESQQKKLTAQKNQQLSVIAKFTGESIPAILIYDMAVAFENQLKIRENTGKLPSPYNEQLVDEILEDHKCICGRPVDQGSKEEEKINGLRKFATTGSLNARIKNVQYLMQEIKGARNKYTDEIITLRKTLGGYETEIAALGEELKGIKSKLELISKDSDTVSTLERDRNQAISELRELSNKEGRLVSLIKENETELKRLQKRFEEESKKIGQGKAIKKEIEKINKISDYISKTVRDHEDKALKILLQELNKVLKTYLIKDFKATINSKGYKVEMKDEEGLDVPESTGEGQVLKFAFISTIIALAGRKTIEKIDFMAEPTVAPLVIDAALSVLDPEYQSSVASNLATQTEQLILFLNSAASSTVANALDKHVGKRYILMAKETISRGKKPIKTMLIGRKEFTLNEYDAVRNESVVLEV